ncbi:MAG: AbrB/MazE/SpoVT family DNA-binding domain-containing protein [Lentisphaerae bacterium]|jgi:antitoxin MazE|nr:AbrB/MazE/SpoVT family DNA-binding domain-containing protein [Lentisphaerota bacterium]
MKATLIAIGNSRGIRIPRTLIELCDFEDQVEIEVQGTTMLLRAPNKARNGWNSAFAAMAEAGDDNLTEVAQTKNSWDHKTWSGYETF